MGPGFILSASIVGSGELIATTRLGAEAGWITLWVIIVSCLVKVAVQLDFSKQAIYSGETTMQALDRLAGPRFGKARWTIWMSLVLMAVKLLQLGGIVGGTALVLFIVVPQVPLPVWCLFTAISVSLIIYRGHYALVERIPLILIALSTLLTLMSVVALQFTPLHISASEVMTGLTFRLPAETRLCGHWRLWYNGCRRRRDHGLQLLAHRAGIRRAYRAPRAQRRMACARTGMDPSHDAGRTRLHRSFIRS